MRRSLIISAFFALLVLAFLSCIISNPRPEDCKIVEVKIGDLSEGGVNDIVFHSNNGDRFYINRGLEQGLNLEDLNNLVVNKSVTLHLAKVLGGRVVSEHISQLALNDSIIYTEFK